MRYWKHYFTDNLKQLNTKLRSLKDLEQVFDEIEDWQNTRPHLVIGLYK
ncbi:MAG: hypothetical protein V7K69_20435 [Nostoc sp.]